MDSATNSKVDKFVSDSNSANKGFDSIAWDKVKATIPVDQQEDAEAKVRAGLDQ